MGFTGTQLIVEQLEQAPNVLASQLHAG
jgi:hypothetical protein